MQFSVDHDRTMCACWPAASRLDKMSSNNNTFNQAGPDRSSSNSGENAISRSKFRFARRRWIERVVTPTSAASATAHTRLRPILMTSFAFIFGVAPMAFASGAGAEMRRPWASRCSSAC